jgi:hypothetical protein
VQKWAFKAKSTLPSAATLGFKSLVHYMLIGVKPFFFYLPNQSDFLKMALLPCELTYFCSQYIKLHFNRRVWKLP